MKGATEGGDPLNDALKETQTEVSVRTRYVADIPRQSSMRSSTRFARMSERQAVMTECDRQNSSLRTGESALDVMEKQENLLSNQIPDKDLMGERIVTMTNEITALNAKFKVRPTDLSSSA
ncbi:hypothetical protein HYDPIDRAFT_116467 [Hydnomerulius pinastri MD-312]|uniref:Uncharacterized protein n=1 Tax=Hydnomerulius pinastri MD-312 TaxID=994086 RepID=A0A0C9W476_9AGAM|nr:hypothetical protein HYDPIDRAFT_116467 [Hydnomerulius pinastri MD-312]